MESSRVSGEKAQIQKNSYQTPLIVVVAGGILSGLGAFLAYRYGNLSMATTVVIGAGGTALSILSAIAIILCKPSPKMPGDSSSYEKSEVQSGTPVHGSSDEETEEQRPLRRPPQPTTIEGLQAQLERAEGSEHLRLRARLAALSTNGQRFDPRRHAIAPICKSGERASQVAYVIFKYAYPTMEVLAPHGTDSGFDKRNSFFRDKEPRNTPPDDDFAAVLGRPLVKKFGQDATEQQQASYDLFGEKYYWRGGNPEATKSTVFLPFGDERLHKYVKTKIWPATAFRTPITEYGKSALGSELNPEGSYEQIADKILDAIISGHFFGDDFT